MHPVLTLELNYQTLIDKMWILLPVQETLRKHRYVNADLQATTNKELHGSFSEPEVQRLECVSKEPHVHHLTAHSKCWLGYEIPVELWRRQEGFCQHWDEANCLHKQGRINEDVHEQAAHGGEREHELYIWLEVCPLPKVVIVKICEDMFSVVA